MNPMSTTESPTGPAPATRPPTRRLVRIRDDKKIAGVTTGLGWYFGVDPVLFRIGFVALAIGGFVAVPVYLAAWLLLPESSRAEESGLPVTSSLPMGGLRERLRVDRDDPRSWLTVGLGVLCLVMIGAQIDSFSGELLLGAILVGLGALLFLDRDEQAPGPPPPPAADQPPTSTAPVDTTTTASDAPVRDAPPEQREPADAGPDGPGRPAQPRSAYDASYAAGSRPGFGPGRWPHGGPGPRSGPWGHGGPGPRGRRARRSAEPRSILGRLAVGLSLLAVGAAALLDRVGLVELTPISGTALVVGVIGLALLVGSRFGRARLLIPLGLVATLALAGMNAAAGFDLRFGSGIGERAVTVVTADDLADRYELFLGEMVLDLRDLELSEDASIEAHITAGRLEVILPQDLAASVGGSMTAGEYTILGSRDEGTGLVIDVPRPDWQDGPTLDIQIDVTFGEVLVRRVETLTPQETQ